jgi:putative MATE family efflux protein
MKKETYSDKHVEPNIAGAIGEEIAEHNHLLHGPIVKTLTFLSFPIMFAMLLQMIYSLTDTFWVGRLGANAVASVSLSWPVLFLITSFGGGLAVAGTILVSQYKGKGDRKKVDFFSSQTISIMFFISIILSIVGYYCSDFLISIMGASKEILPDAVKYLQVSFMGLVFSYIYFNFQSLMRGVGEVKIPLYIVIGTVILNFILDPIFILGWGMIPKFGVAGAAWTTTIAQAISSVIGISILLKGNKGIKMHLEDIKPRLDVFKKMFRLGFPSAIGQSIRSVNMLVVIFLVASFGTVSIAAFGLGVRILALVIVPAVGFSVAVSTMIGQNLGAKKLERAEQISNRGMIIAFLLLTFLGTVVFIFAESITTVFVPGELEVIAECVYYIRAMALTFGFIGLQMSIMGTLQGSGNTRKAMEQSILSLVFLFGFAFVLSKFTSMGINGIWWAYPISNVLTAVVSWFYIANGKWKYTKVIEH